LPDGPARGPARGDADVNRAVAARRRVRARTVEVMLKTFWQNLREFFRLLYREPPPC
jgi:hypothetical protein